MNNNQKTQLTRTFSIHKAAFKGNLARIQSTIESNPNFVNSKDFNGATPLHHAAYRGHLDVAKYLLENGAIIDAVDKDLCTPLHNAAFTGESRCLLFLLQKGSNVNHVDIDSATALHKAAYNGKLDSCKFLVKAGADLEIADSEEVTALQKATYNDHFPVLQYLLSEGANPNSVDRKGSTILHKASFNGNFQCIQLLLEKGVKVNVKDKEETTPLHNSVYNGHTDVVQVLLKYGAETNCSTAKYKSTPLHFAAFNGYLDCVKLLVEHKAEINASDVKGLTPLHYAIKREHEDVIEYLLQKGANPSLVDYKNRTWKDMTSNPLIAQILMGERKPSSTNINRTLRSSSSNSAPDMDSPEPNSKNYQPPHPPSTLSIDEDDIYKRLDKNGFLTTEEPEPEDPEQTKIEIARALKWTKMLPGVGEGVEKWDKFLKAKYTKVKTRCEKGIPARVRGPAWKLLTKSTKEQLQARKVTEYKDLIQEESEHVTQINKDINRTFPKHISLMNKDGQQTLFNVLKANAVFNQETGYCQGMAFVTGLFLMYMEEEDAFWVLSQLCNKYNMESVWKTNGLPKCFFILERLMEENVPKVHSFLRQLEITPSQYAMEWFITVFLYNLPFHLVLRIWDIFLFEGFHFIYAVGLALIKVHQERILQMDYEQAFHFMKFNHFKKKDDINVEAIIRKANSYKEIVKRSMKHLEKKYEKKQSAMSKK